MSKTVSAISSLLLTPASGLGYASTATLALLCAPEMMESGAIPGSIIHSDSVESGIYTHKITYKRRSGRDEGCELSRLRYIHLVAVYTDPRGDRRVCGSPEYPLTLEYTESGGLYSVTLQGKSPEGDRRLV